MRSKEQVLAAGLVVLGLVLSSACSRSANSGAEASPNTGAQPANATNSAEPTGSAEAPGSSAQPITITKGTTVEVRLVDAVGSARNQSGDTFHATLAEPIEVHGTVAIPRGADIKGRVVSARASGHLKTPAELAVTLTALEFEGKSYQIETSTLSWRGASHKGHDAKWIGGLAGAGALIGALAGGGKGAAIGAGAGAGAGTAGAYATGKKEIVKPSETPLRFVLRRPLTITRAG